MPISNDDAIAGVRRYLDLLVDGTADQIAALYAPDGTLEDPVGSEPLHGREAIRGFYATIESMKKTTELLRVRACAGEAVFAFRIVTDTGDMTATMEPMEQMVFNEDGLISSMRAWWNENDLTLA